MNKRPLHILLISSSILPNVLAHPIQILKTAHALARQPRVRVTVYCIALKSKPAEILSQYGLPSLPTLEIRGLQPVWWMRWRGMNTHIDAERRPIYRILRWSLRRRWRKLRAGGANVVLYTRNENVLAWLGPTSREDGIPIFIELHWLKYVDRFRKWREKQPALPRLSNAKNSLSRFYQRERDDLQQASGILCLTHQLEDKVRRLGVNRDLGWLPSGVESASADPEIAIDIDVLYLGQLYPWKGVDTLITAMQWLPHSHLTIVGGNQPGDLARVRQLADSLGVTSRITFVGHQQHLVVSQFISRARVCVVPLPGHGYREARSFTSPMKLFEFAAQGRAIVASNLPSLCEVLTHGENAWLVQPDDPRALAAGIQHLLNDHALAQRLGVNVQALAREFSFEKRAERILDFIEKIIVL